MPIGSGLALAFVILITPTVVLKEPAAAQQITIAAASDLNFVLEELARNFEKQTANKVRISFGSSGNFFAQIQNGAPYDLFFSADLDYPQRLEQSGLAESLYRYAIGKLVLWVPKDSKI